LKKTERARRPGKVSVAIRWQTRKKAADRQLSPGALNGDLHHKINGLAEGMSDFSAVGTLYHPLKNLLIICTVLRFHVAVLRRPLLLSSALLWEHKREGGGCGGRI